MAYNIFSSIIQDTVKGKFLPLLIAILTYLALVPVLNDFFRAQIIVDIFFSVILLAGIYGVSRNRRQTLTALSLALPMFITIWLGIWFKDHRLLMLESVLQVFFFAYAVVLVLNFVFRAHVINRNVIYAAIIAYLMLGFLWTGIYMLQHTAVSGAFSISNAELKDPRLLFIYYSFVTLTTLGYGDVTPMKDVAYSSAILEAVVGQLYLTVLVARLVGLHISHFTARQTRNANHPPEVA